MTIYPEQLQAMSQNTLQGQQSLQNQGLMSVGTSPGILAYEQALRQLPSLPLNADERAMVMAAVQKYVQRTASQYQPPSAMTQTVG